MSTLTKEYARKFSSGLTLAILALSGILFLIPVAAPVVAANAVAPTVGLSPNVLSAVATVTVTISNPASNAYAITAFTITGPTGWTFTGALALSTYFTCIPSSNSLACTLKATAQMPPGAADSITGYSLTPATTTTYPVKTTFTTSVQDASSAAYYAGKSFFVYTIDPTTALTLTLSPTSGAFTAGGPPYTVTVAVGGTTATEESGLPVSWTVGGPGAGTISPASGTTGTSGTASATFTPTNNAAAGLNTNCIIVTLGSATAVACGAVATTVSSASGTITTSPGAPASVLLDLGAVAFPSTHYIGWTAGSNNATGAALGMAEILGSSLSYSVADAYSNPVTVGVAITTGSIVSAAGYLCPVPFVTSCVTNIPATTASGTLLVAGAGYDYWQSGTYGWTGEISITLSGTYGTATFTGIHTPTNRIITSTFGGTGSLAFNQPPAPTPPATTVTVAAGSSINVGVAFAHFQQGVPVTMQVCTSCTGTSTKYSGGFGTTMTAATSGTTNSTITTTPVHSEFGAAFYVDTVATSTVALNATWSQPTDTGTNTFTTAASPTIATIAGTPGEFIVTTGFGPSLTPATAYVVNGTTIGLDVSLADAYGNPTLAPSTSPEIQISLAASTGLLSATSVYIPAGDAATNSTVAGGSPVNSFGSIYWTLPSAIGVKATVTGTGVVNGKAVKGLVSVTTVSAIPTLSVTSPVPLSGVIYSNNPTVVFTGEANVSLGYPYVNGPPSATCTAVITTGCTTTAVTIANVGIKVGSSPWTSASLTGGLCGTGCTSQMTWSGVAFLSPGLTTVMFNASDSSGNIVVSAKYSVLVDTTPPVITFVTASGAALNYSQPLKATIVDTEGDLNATSVEYGVTYNGTALASSDVTVTGTNVLGSSVTYSVSIKNLPVGNWTIAVTATDYAGNTATNSTSVKVLVSFANSVIINSAAKGVLGSYTGISVSATNLWSTSQNLVVFAVWKNGAGQTVAVSTGGLTLAAGATGTAFAPLAGGLSSGSYSVSVFVITTGNNPVSSTSSIAVTL